MNSVFSLVRKTLLGTAMAACFTTTAHAVTEINIQYAMPQVMRPAMDAIADEFMKTHPDIKVNFLIPGDTYQDLLQKTLRASLTKSTPDVTFQALGYLRTFVDRDAAVNLDPLIAADEDFQNRGDTPAILDIGKLYGRQYALPFAISTPLIYYNTQALEQVGADPAAFPTTWQGLIELSGKLAALPGMEAGIHMDVAMSPDWYWQLLVNSVGGQMVDEETMTVAFAGEEGKKAMANFEAMRNIGNNTLKGSTGRQSFYAGKVGMFVASNAVIGQTGRTVGDRFEWGVAAIPLDGPDARAPAGGNLAIIHATDPAKQKAAFEFIKFATGPIGSTHQTKTAGYIPPNGLAIEDPELLGKFYEERPAYALTVELAPSLVGWYSYPGEAGLKINDALRRSLLSVVEGRADAEQALTEMVDEVQALLPTK